MTRTATEWVRKKYQHPEQIGWHKGPWAIYACSDYGRCVLTSGLPLNFGPEYFDTPDLAKERAAQVDRGMIRRGDDV